MRRRRTPLLLAGAAVLGLLSGTCAGYLVQAGREPTALPPLSQPRLAQAGGGAPEHLSAAQDRKVKFDGDLRRLLLKKPSDAREAPTRSGEDGWISLARVAEGYNDPAGGYAWQLGSEFRRSAAVGWREGGTRTVGIQLLQYRQEEVLGARHVAEDGYFYAADDGDTDSWAIPGTGDGTAYVHRTPETAYGMTMYTAEAYAWRGDVAMEIWVTDTGPIRKKTILDLAKRQMERL
ncbi:hypothetical protein JK359_07205 [Streptomyces actinomycinicus]|uniref:Uncharacterized protein n=1 Tax=Streptomyces actinomycinicus TaxID=1695166 RepID=A0A937EGM4_9ACTN|nr:hypothetical protein [Streptomyces actinomycinicus]